MLEWKDVWARHEQYQDMMIEAQMHRLIKEGRHQRSWRRQALCGLGRQLVEWGSFLETRYGRTDRGLHTGSWPMTA